MQALNPCICAGFEQGLDILQEKELHLRTPLEELELIAEAEQKEIERLKYVLHYSSPLVYALMYSCLFRAFFFRLIVCLYAGSC